MERILTLHNQSKSYWLIINLHDGKKLISLRSENKKIIYWRPNNLLSGDTRQKTYFCIF